MGTWTDRLSPDERKSWDAWVKHIREDTVEKMASSAFVASIVPGGEPDIQFAVETGLALLMDKPVVLLCMPGRSIPLKLLKIADAVVYLDHDIDTKAGQEEASHKLRGAMKQIGVV